jgi:hypothetical protein
MSPYQQDVINTTLRQYDIQAQKVYQDLQHKQLELELLVVDVKVFKELNIKINQI